VYNDELMRRVKICYTIQIGRVYDDFVTIWLTYDVRDSWIHDSGSLAAVRDHWKGLGLRGFHQILHIDRGFGATEDVDRVFAFLGHPLARKADGKSRVMTPNYTKSLGEVSRVVAEHIYLSTRSLFLLCYVEHRNDDEIDRSLLPSWVPVWTERRYRSVLPHHHWGQ
jgi:hypothetical protein